VEPEDHFVQARGDGATEGEAYLDAVAQLATVLFGPESWLSSLGVGIHEAGRDPMHSSATGDGQVQVMVGLDRERVEEVFEMISSHPYQASPPAHLLETFRQIYQGRLARSVCLRRRELLEWECSPPSIDGLANQMAELAQTIRLQPFFPDGLPLDARGRPLRPILVIAEQRTPGGEWIRLPGLALNVSVPLGTSTPETTAATTNDGGVARFPLGEGRSLSEGTEVVLDRERFLGPLSDLWPGQRLGLSGRLRGVQRWCLVATVRVQGEVEANAPFRGAFQQSMRDRGIAAMVGLRTDQEQPLRAASVEGMTATLPRVADAMAGQIDVLYRVELVSEYASRMGPHRMWYEARGRVEVFDAWTGRQLTTIEDTITAADVGNERANAAAQEQLAARLVNQILTDVPAVLE
jgi:hypothetical protein